MLEKLQPRSTFASANLGRQQGERAPFQIGLGIKQMQKNPWENIEARYPTGTHIKGKISKLVAYGGSGCQFSWCFPQAVWEIPCSVYDAFDGDYTFGKPIENQVNTKCLLH